VLPNTGLPEPGSGWGIAHLRQNKKGMFFQTGLLRQVYLCKHLKLTTW